jgi:hypothetical protein
MDIYDGRALAQDGTCVTKRWTPTDWRAAAVPGRKARWGQVSLRGLEGLPIPKVSLYKIVYCCRFEPDPEGTTMSATHATLQRCPGHVEGGGPDAAASSWDA